MVMRSRRKVATQDIVAHFRVPPTEEDGVPSSFCRRLGLAVSKSVGNAVVRNSVKRRFRVLARRHEDMLPPRCDVVLRAKPSAATASFADLDVQVAHLFDSGWSAGSRIRALTHETRRHDGERATS